MIVVTPNLCVDRTYWLDTFESGTVSRPHRVEVGAGGKGVNVARTLRDLGRDCVVLGLRPHDGGSELERLLRAEGATPALVDVPGAVRSAVIVVEAGGRATVLNEPGPPLDASHGDALLERLAELVTTRRSPLVVGAGSLPPGLPVDTYAGLCRTARDGGALVVVDAARDALAAVLPAEPDLVTPNLAEAESVATGVLVEPSTHAEDRTEIRDRARAAARSLRDRGARRAVVTAGEHGAAYADDRGELWCDAPAVGVVNPIGAGDAFVGGVVDHLLGGVDRSGAGWRAAVRRGVAVASAAVGHPRAGRVDVRLVERLLDETWAERDDVA